jgi:AraC family transcriptional regulator of arabinose operon
MIRLVSCGYQFTHEDGLVIHRPAGAGNYAFVYFKSESQAVVNGSAMAVSPYSYILFAPFEPHQYGEPRKLFVNDWLHCEGEELAGLLARLDFPLNTPVQASEPLSISRSIMDLQSVQRLGGPLCEEILDLDLRSFFTGLSNDRHRPLAQGHPHPYFAQFTELRNRLYNLPQARFSVDELAASVNLSKSYFQHIYKELFGCSVLDDIIRSRLEYAKYLLDSTTLAISTISRMCGYEHDTHFMRQFKKFLGTTPSRYRGKC